MIDIFREQSLPGFAPRHTERPLRLLAEYLGLSRADSVPNPT
jgi:hypothetical protein